MSPLHQAIEKPEEPPPEPPTNTIIEPETPQLPLQALIRVSNFHTMRVTGMHDKKLIQVVLDSSSTHNFLDLEIAQKLVYKLEEVTPMSIYLHKFKWTLQQTEFFADVLVLPLGCYELILGIQWLRSLGPIA